MLISKIIKNIIFSIKFDTSNARAKTCLFMFNIFPDLFFLRVFSNVFLWLSGCNVCIAKTYIRKKLSIDSPCNVRFEGGGFINKGLFVEGNGKVYIGDKFQIGPNVHILTTNHLCHADDEVLDVVIGENVWIGACVIITPGTIVCNNVSIAAGSVVACDINEPGLWAGVPAKKMEKNK